jgi:conserved oligomeric Golgi complex subunit 6
LELKATTEDLAKAKTARSTSLQEIEVLRVQLDEAHQAARAAAQAATADRESDAARLTKELSNARDELSALNEALRATQESMQEMGRNHQLELEEAAKGRTEEVSKLRAVHDAEIQALVTDKASLVTKLSDLEGELFTARASAAPAEVVASPKRNGLSTAPIETVTKEELQSMHEAHNLKINDVQAQHEKAMRALQQEVEAAQAKISGAESDMERKNMEIKYLEQEQEESQDQITRYVKLFSFQDRLLSRVFAFYGDVGFSGLIQQFWLHPVTVHIFHYLSLQFPPRDCAEAYVISAP